MFHYVNSNGQGARNHTADTGGWEEGGTKHERQGVQSAMKQAEAWGGNGAWVCCGEREAGRSVRGSDRSLNEVSDMEMPAGGASRAEETENVRSPRRQVVGDGGREE